MKAIWSFVATSYKKSSCNGIGGTIKCFLTRESLQLGLGNTFINVENVLEFCQSRIEKYHLSYWKKENLSTSRQNLQPCFSQAKTITGTHGFHFYFHY